MFDFDPPASLLVSYHSFHGYNLQFSQRQPRGISPCPWFVLLTFAKEPPWEESLPVCLLVLVESLFLLYLCCVAMGMVQA
jgi:hypothetical protein